MRYFHRSTVSPDLVLKEAEQFFRAFTGSWTGPRGLKFVGPLGQVKVNVAMEGGHYTRITVDTDQVAESEADKMAKHFLGIVHTKAEPAHALRGTY
jgi:hypothetical protein